MKSYTSIHDPKDLLTYEFLTKSLGVKKYDETATYSKGALVYHEDATDTYLDSIFEANQDIATAESWTAAHWDTVDLETIIKRSMHKYEPYIEYDGSTAKEVVHMDKCVIFSGDSAFNLGLVGDAWYGSDTSGNPGSLEISTDKKTWATWDYAAKAAVQQANGKYEVYVRGKGNNRTTDSDCSNISTFTISAPVNLIGKHDWIIDYTATNPVCINALNLFKGASIVDASGFVLSKNFDTTAEEEGLGWMFSGCTSLTTPPQLPATQLTEKCYYYMFEGCTSLTTPPTLPATQLAESCYDGMFKGCRSLTLAPELPVTTLADACYSSMFAGCTSLTTPPQLPATQLTEKCYYYMFKGCTSLTTTPELPATTLANYCYGNMFEGCTTLTAPCELPATNIVEYCYWCMFENCTGITWTTDTTATAYIIPSTGIGTVPPGVIDWSSRMFLGNSGTLPGSETTPPQAGTPVVNTTYYYVTLEEPEEFVRKGKEYMEVISGTAPITGFTVDANGVLSFTRSSIEYVTHIDKSVIFTSSNTFNLQLSGNAWHGDGTLEYSTDGHTWETYGTTNATTLPAPKLQDNGKYELYLRGKGNTTTISGGTTKFTTDAADRVNIMGSLDTLLNYTSTPVTTSIMSLFEGANIVDASELVMPTNYNSSGNSHCAMLFKNCTYLTGAPQFPNVTLATACYRNMFYGCTSLTTPPQLPATQLVENCYRYMFYGSGLTSAPALPATTLANQCYSYMFQNCGSLTTAPALPATTVGECCYSYMFENSGLTTAPELPATTVGVQGYEYMFQNCTALTAAPALPATTLGQQCYECMFKGCTGITKIPALPATTISTYGYRQMFEGCTGLKFYPVGSTTSESFTIPSTTTVGTNALANMFQYCTDFPETGGTPVPGTVYGYGDKLPDPYITIESTDSSLFYVIMSTTSTEVGLPNIEWSTDGVTWSAPAAMSGKIAFPASGRPIPTTKVYVRGNGFTHFCDDTGYTTFTFMGAGGPITNPVIKISGELRYLYDQSGETTCGNASGLFEPVDTDGAGTYQAVISDVSELVFPTKLGTNDYGLFSYMFYNYSGSNSQPIKTPPQLPATTLTPNCYRNMFYGCDLLTTPCELPATTLADYCYYQMFCYCEALTTPPALPATTLADYCYNYMFYGCGFTSAPTLPALTVPSGAYVGMFGGCTSLTTPPTLPATTIEIDNTQEVSENGDGYEWMFYGCTSLTTIPTMPASITINRTGEYAESSPRAFYQMFEAEEIGSEPIVYNPSLDFSKSDKSWICPTITDAEETAANLSNMFQGQNGITTPTFADTDGTPIAGITYNYGNV